MANERIRELLWSTSKTDFDLKSAVPARGERIKAVECFLFAVEGAVVTVNEKNCVFHFQHYMVSDDDDGSFEKSNVFSNDLALGPTLSSGDPNVVVVLPHGNFAVAELVKILNRRISAYTQRMRFVYEDGAFVKLIFKDAASELRVYEHPFTFKISNADPGLSGIVIPGAVFKTTKGSFVIELTSVSGKIHGTDVGVGVGLKAAAADANGYSRSDMSASVPFLCALGGQLFEVTAIESDTRLRVSNPSRGDWVGNIHLRTDRLLQGDKIVIPSERVSADYIVRKFGASMGCVMRSLGFESNTRSAIHLVGHVSAADYKRQFLGGENTSSTSFSRRFDTTGRIANTRRMGIVSSGSIREASNPGGAVELFVVTPVNTPIGANLINGIEVSATHKPELAKFVDNDEHAFTLHLNAQNTLELTNEDLVSTIEDGHDRVRTRTNFSSGLAILLQNYTGDEVLYGRVTGARMPSLLRLIVRDETGKKVTHAVRCRIGLRVTYEKSA